MAGESKSSGVWKWLRIVAIGRRPGWTVVRLLVLVGGAAVLFGYVLLPIRVSGISMEPTYHDGSVNFINRLAYSGGRQPARGEVVAIRMAGRHVLLLKRVVGLPGERLAFRGGVVWINGAPVDEPYLKLPHNWMMRERTLGPDEYYFVGDNRSMDLELHEHGSTTADQILGRVVLAGNR